MSAEDFDSIKKHFGILSGATEALNHDHIMARGALLNQIMDLSLIHI